MPVSSDLGGVGAIAVIGAGPAGMLAAYRLQQGGARVTVYERAAEVGGADAERGGCRRGREHGRDVRIRRTESDALCTELAIPTVAIAPPTFGVHYHGRTVIARKGAELVAGLLIPAEAKYQLADLIAQAHDEYGAHTGTGGLAEESSRLGNISLTEHLGELHPVVAGIVGSTVRGGSTADPDDLSAQYALRYFSSNLLRAAGHRRYIAGGMQRMCAALQERLRHGALRLDAEVKAVLGIARGSAF